MEIKETRRITLTEADIREIIKDYLYQKGYYGARKENITFDIGTGYRNDGTPGGFPYEYLSGCTVKL